MTEPETVDLERIPGTNTYREPPPKAINWRNVPAFLIGWGSVVATMFFAGGGSIEQVMQAIRLSLR